MTVKFIHLRRWDPFDGFLEPTGGVTIAYVIRDNLVSYTWAHCSAKDHYTKAIGRAISKGRLDAFKNVLSFDKVEGVNVVEQVIKHHDINEC